MRFKSKNNKNRIALLSAGHQVPQSMSHYVFPEQILLIIVMSFCWVTAIAGLPAVCPPVS